MVKKLITALALTILANASMAGTINCGAYVIEDVATCRAYGSVSPVTSSTGLPSPFVNATVTGGGGNLSIATYAGGTATLIGNNSPMPQPPASIIETALNATSQYLVLVFDTPVNTSAWMIFEASGAAFGTTAGGVDITEGTGKGNYKYGIYSLTRNPSPVPLPASWLLLGVGALGLGLFGNRKKA